MTNVIDFNKERQKRAAKKYESYQDLLWEDSPSQKAQRIRQSITRISQLFSLIKEENYRSK